MCGSPPFYDSLGKRIYYQKKNYFQKMVIKIISMKVLKLWIFVDGYCIKIYNYGKIISKIISKMRRFYGRI